MPDTSKQYNEDNIQYILDQLPVLVGFIATGDTDTRYTAAFIDDVLFTSDPHKYVVVSSYSQSSN